MTRDEANNIFKIYRNYYKTASHDPFENQEVRNLYGNFFLKQDYDFMMNSLDEVFTTFKFCPKLAELKDFCESKTATVSDPKMAVWQQERTIKCYVCMDRGAILHRLSDGYEYALHCECEIGKSAMYDGRTLTEHQSPYMTEPIGKYLDTRILRDENKKVNQGTGGREAAIAEAKRLGFNLKILMNPPERTREKCPF